MFKPRWVFSLYCSGAGDRVVVNDPDLPMSYFRRVFYRVRGVILTASFGWFWWQSSTQQHVAAEAEAGPQSAQGTAISDNQNRPG